jgi:hypothetical protein
MESDSKRKFYGDDGTPVRNIHIDAAGHCVDMLADWFIRKDPHQAKVATAKKRPVRRFISTSFARGFLRWGKGETSGS